MLLTSLKIKVNKIKKVLTNQSLAIKYLSDTNGIELKITVSSIQTVLSKIKNTIGFFNTLISTLALVNNQKIKNKNAIQIIGSVGIESPKPPDISDTKKDNGTREQISNT